MQGKKCVLIYSEKVNLHTHTHTHTHTERERVTDAGEGFTGVHYTSLSTFV